MSPGLCSFLILINMINSQPGSEQITTTWQLLVGTVKQPTEHLSSSSQTASVLELLSVLLITLLEEVDVVEVLSVICKDRWTEGQSDRGGVRAAVYRVYCIVKSSVLYQLTYQWVLVEKEIYPWNLDVIIEVEIFMRRLSKIFSFLIFLSDH